CRRFTTSSILQGRARPGRSADRRGEVGLPHGRTPRRRRALDWKLPRCGGDRMAQKEAEARAERLQEALDKAKHQDGSVSSAQDSSGGAAGGTAPLILVGLDGSPTSWDAFSCAAGEAIRCNGGLVAVYIVPAVEP